MMRWIWLLLGVPAVSAITINVNTGIDQMGDDGLTTLREAVIWANTNAGLDTIVLPAGVYLLTREGTGEDDALTGDLDFKDHTIIQGAGARDTIIDAGGIDRVMFFDHNLEIALYDVTISGGQSFGDGGGLYNQATTRLVRCQVGGNIAYNAGGGILNWSGALFLDQCAVYYNAAGGVGSGGIDIYTGLCSLSNCTVSGNVSGRGAGLYTEYGELRLFGCTVVSNSASSFGGGVFGDVSFMQNTLVALNQAATGPDIYGDTGSQGYNLVSQSAGSSGYLDSDLLDTNALVGELRYYGGSTPTHNLQPGSPALNQADPNYPTNDIAFDQRGTGYRRLRGIGVDIGAYEHQRPDHDLDGMPDEWEQANNLNPTSNEDGPEDDDEDGFSNQDEYQADTLPGDPDSFFELLDLERGAASNRCVFLTSTARLYRVEVAVDVGAPVWSNVTGWLSGQLVTTAVTDTNPPPEALYRVSVRAP